VKDEPQQKLNSNNRSKRLVNAMLVGGLKRLRLVFYEQADETVTITNIFGQDV